MPAITFRMDDLPDPDGPTNVNSSPERISRLGISKAFVSPNNFLTSLNRRST